MSQAVDFPEFINFDLELISRRIRNSLNLIGHIRVKLEICLRLGVPQATACMPALAQTLTKVDFDQEQDEGPEEEVGNLHYQIEQVVLECPGVRADVLTLSKIRRVSDL